MAQISPLQLPESLTKNPLPDLCLHICCAPDMAWGITVLKDQFNLHCFFSNPNIYPQEEYTKRIDESYKVAQHFNVPLSADTYNPKLWEEAIAGHEDTAEQGLRCAKCFSLRLKQSADFAQSKGISKLATVLSVSPHKRISMINESGNAAIAGRQMAFIELNLKKNDGFLKSIHLSTKLTIYRQDYCGCRLSRIERDIRNQKSTQQKTYLSSATE